MPREGFEFKETFFFPDQIQGNISAKRKLGFFLVMELPAFFSFSCRKTRPHFARQNAGFFPKEKGSPSISAFLRFKRHLSSISLKAHLTRKLILQAGITFFDVQDFLL